jgi:hypothetical protein
MSLPQAPSATAARWTPGRWIKPGDVVELWIEGIGAMRLTAKREKREASLDRDGMLGLLPLPEHAQDYPQRPRDGQVENPLDRGR